MSDVALILACFAAAGVQQNDFCEAEHVSGSRREQQAAR